MKIEEGKYYRARDGRVIGPMQEVCHSTEIWKFTAVGFYVGNPCWTDEGRWSDIDEERDLDLISEVYVSDTPPADASAPKPKNLRDEFAITLMDADDFMVGFKEHAEQLYRAAERDALEAENARLREALHKARARYVELDDKDAAEAMAKIITEALGDGE